MIDEFRIVTATLAGVVLGTFFFGGLWWTVQKGLSSSRPAALFLCSLLLRTLLVVGGFFFVSRGDWRYWIASLIGFVLARLMMTRVVKSAEVAAPSVIRGAPR